MARTYRNGPEANLKCKGRKCHCWKAQQKAFARTPAQRRADASFAAQLAEA